MVIQPNNNLSLCRHYQSFCYGQQVPRPSSISGFLFILNIGSVHFDIVGDVAS